MRDIDHAVPIRGELIRHRALRLAGVSLITITVALASFATPGAAHTPLAQADAAPAESAAAVADPGYGVEHVVLALVIVLAFATLIAGARSPLVDRRALDRH